MFRIVGTLISAVKIRLIGSEKSDTWEVLE